MAVRILVMFGVMIFEAAVGVAAILGVCAQYPRRMDEGGAAGCVMIVALTAVAWLMTIAFFVRRSSRAKVARIVTDARVEASVILAEATEKALALCSLDGGRCSRCGNPRTGKYCPKCGSAGGAPAA
jgi:hypothetical protein